MLHRNQIIYFMKETVPTPLEESIHILNVLNNLINEHQRALAHLTEYNVDVNVFMTLNHMTFQYTIIQVASYLDEYHSYFSQNLNEIQKEYIKPLYRRIKEEINRFPDVKNFRNHISAHNLRIKNKSVALYQDFNTYRVPQNIIELGFLTVCIDTLTKIINGMFPGTYEKIGNLVNLKNKQEGATNIVWELTGVEAESLLKKLSRDLRQLEIS